MNPSVQVKICGLTQPQELQACLNNPVRFIGLVFVPGSRHQISIAGAATIARQVPSGVRVVGLCVDPDDQTLHDIVTNVPLDMLQLHGSETVERVTQVKQQTGLQIMKAIPVREEQDLNMTGEYASVADWLLFDSRSECGKSGGRGEIFDWNLLRNLSLPCPFMLAGGLRSDNVATAIDMVRPNCVDVSSGVEGPDGKKDACKIREFVEAVAHD